MQVGSPASSAWLSAAGLRARTSIRKLQGVAQGKCLYAGQQCQAQRWKQYMWTWQT